MAVLLVLVLVLLVLVLVLAVLLVAVLLKPVALGVLVRLQERAGMAAAELALSRAQRVRSRPQAPQAGGRRS